MNKRKMLLFVANILLVIPLLGSILSTPVAKAVCSDCWEVVSSADPGPGEQREVRLNSVASISSNDGWAVGYYVGADYGHRSLIDRWDGASWKPVASPNPGTTEDYLTGVAAVSSTDVWAVGYWLDNSTTVWRTLILHWNGTSWQQVTSPNPGATINYLYGIAAVNGSDITAVGYYRDDANGLVYKTLILYYNGSTWSTQFSPNDLSDTYLYAVSASSSTSRRAVGTYVNTSGVQRTFIATWVPSQGQWIAGTSPNTGTGENVLKGVTVLGSDDAWAIGYYVDSNGHKQTLTEHLSGSQWSVVSSPNTMATNNFLNASAYINSSYVWAVGGAATTLPSTLTERWNGSQWSIVSSPNGPTNSAGAELLGVSVRPGTSVSAGGEVWAVGYYIRNYDGKHLTLVLRYTIPSGTHP